MVGAIRKRDVIGHPVATIRCFGWGVFLRTLVAERDRTFLSIVLEADARQVRSARAPDVLRDCITLELQALRLYECLALRFSASEPARRLFAALAGEEREHADLLEVCRAAAAKARREPSGFDEHRETVARLRKEMDGVERGLDRIQSVADALRLVLKIEGSEINGMFRILVAGADSDFVRAVGAFRRATETHLSRAAEEVARIEPALAEESRRLASGAPTGHAAPPSR